jgi:hypothetical protein
MLRKAKKLAGALLAICAVGAGIASGASAQQFHIKDMGNATGDGAQLEQKTAFQIPEGQLICKDALFNVHTLFKLGIEIVEGKIIEKELDVETTGTTVTIKAEEPKHEPAERETLTCTFAGLSGTIVHMNGCDFRLHAGTFIGATVICPPEKQITVTAIVVGVLKCTIHIGTQDDLKGITIQNTKEPTPDDIDVSFGILSQIKYTSTPGEGLGKCTETQVGTDGSFQGKVTVQGTAGGVASDVWYE